MAIPALILARGGSKGIPGKNLKDVGGVSLLGHCVQAAMSSQLSPVYVWSDDQDIRLEGESYGAICPSRNKNHSSDSITSEECVKIFLKKYDPNKEWPAVALLQCTTPFLTSDVLDQCFLKFRKENRDAVITVADATQRYFGYPQRGNGKSEFIAMRPYRALRQEESMTMWMENGGCYLAKRDLWIAGRRLGSNNGVVCMPWWDGLEIDEPEDLEIARLIAPTIRNKRLPVRFIKVKVTE